MTVELPPVDRPAVSIVVVTYGGWDWPRRCLEAVRDHTDVPYEIVVVDNASPDETPERLREEIHGARLIFNDRNVGFAPAVNQAVLEARGEQVAILNPDTLVEPGWAGPLLEAVGDPSVGAVVPMYLNPDGTIQEAGSLVDHQGWTHAVGAGAAAGDPAYRFRRDVDYGSAACLIMRRETFHLVGGLDPAYLPAYVEDVDLAFSLRALGLRMVYEPRARVVHGGTVSSDVAARTRMIEANREVLLARWAEELAGRPPLTELDELPHRLVTLRDALAPIRVLAVADRLPPDGPPGSLLAELAEGWPEARITVAAREVPDPAPLLGAGVEVVASPDDGWFEARRYHATAVLLWGPDPAARHRDVLERTQPQALRVYAPDSERAGAAPDERSDTERRADEVAALREADLLLTTPTGAATARAIAPGTPLLALDDPDASGAFMASLGAARAERS
jgi:O-antigen biosynthesis protein